MATSNGNKKHAPKRRKAPLKADGLTEPLSGSKFQDLQTKPANYVTCRSYTVHQLKDYGFFRWGRDKDCLCRISECSICGTLREDYFYPNGELMDRIYVYPDDYLLEGEGRVTRHEAVATLLRKVGVNDSGDLPNRVSKKLSPKGLQSVTDAVM